MNLKLTVDVFLNQFEKKYLKYNKKKKGVFTKIYQEMTVSEKKYLCEKVCLQENEKICLCSFLPGWVYYLLYYITVKFNLFIPTKYVTKNGFGCVMTILTNKRILFVAPFSSLVFIDRKQLKIHDHYMDKVSFAKDYLIPICFQNTQGKEKIMLYTETPAQAIAMIYALSVYMHPKFDHL